MTTAALAFVTALLALLWLRSVRLSRALEARLGEMSERIRDMGARFEAAEADVAHAVTRADIAEVLLVEKGVADEEDLEAVRRRFFAPEAPPVEEHEGELN